MNTAEIINGKRTVRLRDGTEIEVRELSWMDSLAFLKLLGDKAGDIGRRLFADTAVTDAAQANDRAALVERILVHLSAIIGESLELMDFLIRQSLAKDVRDKVPGLCTTDALKILRTALELVLNDELVAEGNGIAAALSRVFATVTMNVTTTPASDGSDSNPSSSGRDILRPLPTPTPSASSSSTPASSPTV